MRLGPVGHVEEVNRSDRDSYADCCVCGGGGFGFQ
jgi:hypothetical protein